MSLSVCLVTRNEEENLPRLLRSVAGVADEVLVADTASKDRTVEIAAAAGARVVQHDWRDDFSAARNFALDQAQGDWILWLNPDEELLGATREQLASLASLETVLGYTLRVQEVSAPDRLDSPVGMQQPRLFRRHPALPFKSRLPAEEAFELARRWFPDSPPLLWRAAEAWFGWSNFRGAATMLERLLELGRTGRFDRSAAFDPDIIGDLARLNLAVCYRRLGDYDRAEARFRELLNSLKHADQARTQLADLERLRAARKPG